jgi:hypothetical protein
MDWEQQHVDTLLALDGQPLQVGGSDNVRFVMPVFLTRSPLAASSEHEFVIANGHDVTLELINTRSLTRRQVNVPVSLQAVSAEDFSVAAEDFLRMAGETLPPEARAVVDAMEPPPTRAPFRRMLFDPVGLLWLELDDGSTVTRTWLVTGADGNVRGRVSMPPGFELLEPGEDRVAGVWRDSLGVEVVHIHGLNRR